MHLLRSVLAPAIFCSFIPVLLAKPLSELVPPEKHLDPAWVASLTARGELTRYSGEDLKCIHMPVGGITAGQLYLNGDGSLSRWDIFNKHQLGKSALNTFADPEKPLAQGIALRLRGKSGERWVPLSPKGFSNVTFIGTYPIGRVEYSDPTLPVKAVLEAFSPFIPLDAADSGLPATILRVTVTNASSAPIKLDAVGWLENAINLYTGLPVDGERVTTLHKDKKALFLDYSAAPSKEPTPVRSAIVFADFKGSDYADWKPSGTAFGSKPTAIKEPKKGRKKRDGGKFAASSRNGGDKSVGRLISPEFTIERRHIDFSIAGAENPETLRVDLIVDGKPVRTATGSRNPKSKNKASAEFRNISWYVGDLEGKRAHIEVVDQDSSPGGFLLLGAISFADRKQTPLAERGDFGTMAFGLLNPQPGDAANPSLATDPAAGKFTGALGDAEDSARRPIGQPLIGALSRPLELAPGQSATVRFVIAWHFPNLILEEWNKEQGRGYFYASRFDSAAAVLRYVAENLPRLEGQTDLWCKTWYDSTLPKWVLEQVMANASTLATNTCYRFKDGRFYGFEGVHSFPGTCNHVWHYAEAPGRLFPELEMSLRTMADYVPAVGLKSDGSIAMRIDGAPGSPDPLPEQPTLFGAGYQHWASIDGQAGILLRTLRNDQTSTDDSFIKEYWPRIKSAANWLIKQDSDGDGLADRLTHHTLDEDISGPSPWISSLYLAALEATEKMARIAGDTEFASQCAAIVQKGRKNFVDKLWKKDRFVHLCPPEDRWRPGPYDGSHIDQVIGQQWAWRLGLDRILPADKTRTALASIYKYNFAPDVGPYYAQPENHPSRAFSVRGEKGTFIATWPDGSYRPDGNFPGKEWNRGRRFHQGFYNETMTGFEYQVASHMIWEGLVQEGLAVARAVHDRYQPDHTKPQTRQNPRNPFNEPEAGEHYARSMASYAIFMALCGYDYDGPRGYLGFAPRLRPENFRAAFTAAEGWGTFAQQIEGGSMKAQILLRSGKLRLESLSLQLPEGLKPSSVKITAAGREIASSHKLDDRSLRIAFNEKLDLAAGQQIEITIH